MEFLKAIPHKEGLKILQDELYDDLTHGKFVLIDNKNHAYHTGDVVIAPLPTQIRYNTGLSSP